MRKLNSFILACVLISSSLSGCGMPGPLYQQSDKEQASNASQQDKQTQSNEQQE